MYEGDALALAKDGMPGFNPELFAAMADMIYKKGGFDINQLKSKEARSVMAETARIINSGVSSSLPEDCPDALRYALENNAFIFSGFKTFHSMREIGLSMVTDRGTVKQYEDFKKDVQRINAHYNTNYLHAEYYHAVGSAQMAARWNEYAKDGDRYDLQYRTAGDSRVREEHRLLDGITLPVDDPFWDKYFPPNGWGCRCEAVQVRKGKYTLSDSADSMRKGDNITAGVKQQMFRFNPGKTMKLFPPKHPYYKVPNEVKKVLNERSASYERNYKKYLELLHDNDYTDVTFDAATGGLKATHRRHNFDRNKGWYERSIQNVGYKNGHSVVLGEEPQDIYKQRSCEGHWDNRLFEVAGAETASPNNIRNALKHCASKPDTAIAILFFPNNNFSVENFLAGYAKYEGLKKTSQYKEFELIYCIQGEEIVQIKKPS